MAGTTIVVLLFLMFVGIGFYHEHKSYTCRECSSHRDGWQWRFGEWPSPSVPLANARFVTIDSAAFKRMMTSDHQHDWVFARGSAYFFGQSMGCSLGQGRSVNPFLEHYEHSPSFREHVDESIGRQLLTEADLRRLVQSDFKSHDTDHFIDASAEKLGRRLIGDYETKY